MRKIVMDEKTKAYYRLPRIRNKRWTMLIGIVLLIIGFVCFSYVLYDLIIQTMAMYNKAGALEIISMLTFSGITVIYRVLAPFIILGILIYEIRSLVDLIRRIRESDKE